MASTYAETGTATQGTGSELRVNLERDLTRSNVLLELALSYLKLAPGNVLHLLSWVRRGTHYMDGQLAAESKVDVGLLLYDQDCLDELEKARSEGRHTVLDSQRTPKLAVRVSEFLGLFNEVSSESSKSTATPYRFAPARRSALLRALRPHHWLKNMLLFVPMLAAHELYRLDNLLDVIIGFAAFCLCASAVYVANDLCDLASDRQHPRKQSRPFASGDVPVAAGLALLPVLVICSVALTLLLPGAFAIMLAAYFTVTLAYTVRIKQVVGLDVIVLALLYALRVGAGAAAASMDTSYWLLAFCMFMFLSLAMLKRYAELRELEVLDDSLLHGRGYLGSDIPALLSLGGASGYISVLVLVLYINGEEVTLLYENPQVIWLLCPLLLFWISRMWLVAQRGELREDPLLFAVRDKASLMVAAASLVTILFAV